MTAPAQLEHLPLAALTPYAKNARTHSAAQLAQLVASLQQFGFTNPILIDGQGGIIAGHGRFLAAQQLGLATVPCLRLAHLSEVQKRAYIITDNQTALTSGWDEDLLALELSALRLDGFDLELTGFDGAELDRLINGLDAPGPATEGDTEPQPDRAEELREKWGVEPGQLWHLGAHRLLCGNSSNPADMERLLAGDILDAIATDPPYSSGGLHKASRSASTKDKYQQTESNKNYTEFSGDNRDQRSFTVWASIWLDLWRNQSAPAAYLFCFSDWRQVPAMTDAIQSGGWLWRGVNVWDKSEGARIAHQAYFRAQAEFAIWATNGALPSYYEKGAPVHPGVFLNPIDSDKQHLTQKPVAVMEWLLRITKQGGIVGEPFSGSGTTIIACENLGRRCRAIEISPPYVAVALERWHQHTGMTPVRDA